MKCISDVLDSVLTHIGGGHPELTPEQTARNQRWIAKIRQQINSAKHEKPRLTSASTKNLRG